MQAESSIPCYVLGVVRAAVTCVREKYDARNQEDNYIGKTNYE